LRFSVRPLLTLSLHHDQDVVTARQRAAQIASLLGFDLSEQTRIATAVSEVVRNAFRYTGAGQVVYQIEFESAPNALIVDVVDKGRGIPHLDDVMAGRYRSQTGMGTGILGARRLMDRFHIDSSTQGTTVRMTKFLPPQTGQITVERATRIANGIAERQPRSLAEEVQQQNQELLRAFDELQRRQQELVHLNRELEDTNRGVVALYAELEERAESLRQADQLKSRFLSNMTHEFRTPVNSIIGLCNLIDEEQRNQGGEPDIEIAYIRKAAEQLSELVNDLLDLARVEAGKSSLRLAQIEVDKIFGALRGMLRPLLLNQSVSLVFEDAADLPTLYTDEAKVSQILRNLISNALKFTERGEVRVAAALDGPEHVRFTVADTGIGIAAEDQERIFEEFTQVEHRLQRGVKGTGLGLSLSRRLAELLGGTISVTSRPGAGSTFSVELPVRAKSTLQILVIDDEDVSRFLIRQCLVDPSFQIVEAGSGEDGLERARVEQPDIVLLDLVLPGMHGSEVLQRFREDPQTAGIPVLIVTAAAIDAEERARLLDRAVAVVSKAELSRERLGEMVRLAARGARRPSV
jgi:signal transduction histidine kinase